MTAPRALLTDLCPTEACSVEACKPLCSKPVLRARTLPALGSKGREPCSSARPVLLRLSKVLLHFDPANVVQAVDDSPHRKLLCFSLCDLQQVLCFTAAHVLAPLHIIYHSRQAPTHGVHSRPVVQDNSALLLQAVPVGAVATLDAGTVGDI